MKTLFFWYALYTASRAEKKVKKRLDMQGIECYLPMGKEVRKWSDRKKEIEFPLIPGYIFVRISQEHYVKVLSINGVVGILREANKAVVIPDNQIERLRKALDEIDIDVDVEYSVDHFKPGVFVKIKRGNLKDFVGELVEFRGKAKLLFRLNCFGGALFSISSDEVEVLKDV